MLSFFTRKGWGYAEDELITTHPIRSQVANTHMAESIFDGITYSKGAATMKQLMWLIGEDNFSKALGNYFQKYAFRNAVLDDLLSEIKPYFSEESGVTVEEWKKMWLETAGTNTLGCSWAQESPNFTINQWCVRPEHPTLRTHRIKVAFIEVDHQIHVLDYVVRPQAATPAVYPAHIKPVAVILNYEDLTFAKTEVDPTSQKYFK